MSYPLQPTDVPLTATHPGDLLKDEIEERGLTQQQLAEKLRVSQPLLSEIINHKRRVSLEMALKLEDALGIPAEIWLNLQKRYDFRGKTCCLKPSLFPTSYSISTLRSRSVFSGSFCHIEMHIVTHLLVLANHTLAMHEFLPQCLAEFHLPVP